jgi:putative SOS response-associated peptidase YedK
VTSSSVAELAEKLDIDDVRAEEEDANYNVTPRSEVPIVAVSEERGRVLDRVRWGLVPSWAENLKIGDKLINARAETIRKTPAYRHAFAKRRCLIPADGFYEWKRDPAHKTKQPYFIHPAAGATHSAAGAAPFAFAGVYATWRDKSVDDAPWIRSCAIVTTGANASMAAIHNRMPVLLEPSDFDAWLDPTNADHDALEALLVPAPANEIDLYPIRSLVNKPANNFKELLEPVPV